MKFKYGVFQEDNLLVVQDKRGERTKIVKIQSVQPNPDDPRQMVGAVHVDGGPMTMYARIKKKDVGKQHPRLKHILFV